MNAPVTRIAPSPTGHMHIGTVRTALFNYLFAKRYGGTFFVRIEDTDRERNKDAWVNAIWDDFAWCGLTPDARYIQSEHLSAHTNLLRILVENGKAYVSKEQARDGSGRDVEVVRLRNTGGSVTFTDLVRGEVTFDTAELGDFVIARSLDDPLYHFAVVVDDHEAGVTHIIRAEEHISNTPRQILIQEALGFPRPQYAHIPLILAPDRSKLSKRTHSASVEQYREQGFLPEAVVNYLALLGWNPGTDEELFTLRELIEQFSLEQVQKGGAVFDEQKLRWFNRQYLSRMSATELHAYVYGFLPQHITDLPGYTEEVLGRALPLIVERIDVGADVTRLAEEGELAFFFTAPAYNPELLVGKNETRDTARLHLAEVCKLLDSASSFGADEVKQAVWSYAEQEGKGAVLWPMRVALSGRERSPDPFSIASVLGKAETMSRLRHAHELLEQTAS